MIKEKFCVVLESSHPETKLLQEEIGKPGEEWIMVKHGAD